VATPTATTFAAAAPGSDFTFVQISDSHVGFKLPANPDVLGTLNATVDKINALGTMASLGARRGVSSLRTAS
jgi:3',5'-cyclic-AMP phosphodiesterase